MAKQHGKVVMAKVDIDDHTDLAIEYEVWIGRGSPRAAGLGMLGATGQLVQQMDVLGTTREPVRRGVLGFFCFFFRALDRGESIKPLSHVSLFTTFRKYNA